MPNWCENTARIVTGDEKAIEAIRKSIRQDEDGKTWFLDELVPLVENGKGGQEEYDYDKAISTWGTRTYGDVYGYSEDEAFSGYKENVKGKREFFIDFWTAWTPPTGFYKRLAAKYDVLIYATYSEPSCGFEGEFDCKHDNDSEDGVTIMHDNTWDYEENSWSEDDEEELEEVE